VLKFFVCTGPRQVQKLARYFADALPRENVMPLLSSKMSILMNKTAASTANPPTNSRSHSSSAGSSSPTSKLSPCSRATAAHTGVSGDVFSSVVFLPPRQKKGVATASARARVGEEGRSHLGLRTHAEAPGGVTQMNSTSFVVRHFAGDVAYSAGDWLEKNNDKVRWNAVGTSRSFISYVSDMQLCRI
jgi:hypothetical protein